MSRVYIIFSIIIITFFKTAASQSSHMDFIAEHFSPEFSISVSPKIGDYRSKLNSLYDPMVLKTL